MARKNKNKAAQQQPQYQSTLNQSENCSMSYHQKASQQAQNCNMKQSSQNCK